MLTAAYDFNSLGLHGNKSRAKYRKPVAVVVGTIKGVPFRQVFKTWEAAENLKAKLFGAELFLI